MSQPGEDAGGRTLLLRSTRVRRVRLRRSSSSSGARGALASWGRGPLRPRRTEAKLGPGQVQLARQMYGEVDANVKQKWTVQQIAEGFGVTRPTTYRR
jgi:hypothetical protein